MQVLEQSVQVHLLHGLVDLVLHLHQPQKPSHGQLLRTQPEVEVIGLYCTKGPFTAFGRTLHGGLELEIQIKAGLLEHFQFLELVLNVFLIEAVDDIDEALTLFELYATRGFGSSEEFLEGRYILIILILIQSLFNKLETFPLSTSLHLKLKHHHNIFFHLLFRLYFLQ